MLKFEKQQVEKLKKYYTYNNYIFQSGNSTLTTLSPITWYAVEPKTIKTPPTKIPDTDILSVENEQTPMYVLDDEDEEYEEEDYELSLNKDEKVYYSAKDDLFYIRKIDVPIKKKFEKKDCL